MNGKRVLKRVVLAFGLTTMFLVFLAVADGHATPVKPDIKQLLAQPAPEPLPVARAGWNGPETPPSPREAPNPLLETFGVPAQQRQVLAAMRAAAVPEPWAVAAVVFTILLLRLLRQRLERRAAPATAPAPPIRGDDARPLAA